ncbi:MAG: DNA topoisomerase IV subunit B [Rickettsiales bacterium]|jgi:topoisomerase-4 subunit B|nr:DNA topoisomerase IV subunit B [Rickettsiales bacterium]
MAQSSYSAKDIEVLEGLEPVRMRPGMYIGGVDANALHHLASEILDNAMDEVGAGFAREISMEILEDGRVRISDDGRGIPVDDHPKFPGKSALEVILTTLHSGGKFSDKVYQTSGGLHGVGSSVVNALSEEMTVEVSRGGNIYRQKYSRGLPTSKLEIVGKSKKTGTTVEFKPDATIFGEGNVFKPLRLFRMARSKAFLFKGVVIHWKSQIPVDGVPAEATLNFPNGIADFLAETIETRPKVIDEIFYTETPLAEDKGRVEVALSWIDTTREEGATGGFISSYANTIPTPDGGTHEAGFKSAITKSLKSFADMVGNKKFAQVISEDIFDDAAVVLSLFYKNPQFQGQTKEKFSSAEATRLIDTALKNYFDYFLTQNPAQSNLLLGYIIEKAEARLKLKKLKETIRKSPTKKLRLPGKLADCSNRDRTGTELFLVEGDSAGGSAKQARSRATQAILPLRGKILNVASASSDKLSANKEIGDITEALGAGAGRDYNEDKLRYDKVIIMTDADVDGAHIASLLMTFFFEQMPGLIADGHLYLALPPLFKVSDGRTSYYAMDEQEKDAIIARHFKGKKVEISRFKGLGEMMPGQLKETTMDPKTRQLLRVEIPPHTEEGREDFAATRELVANLMGKNAEFRFRFIQEGAKFGVELDI